MTKHFLALYEETARGTKTGSPIFLPVTKGLAPKFSPKDEPRKEFRGPDVALGDSAVVRKESQFTVSPECFLYPGLELGKLLKHLLGFAGTRVLGDVSSYKGILYPVNMPYGSGPLADGAIGYCPNRDREGVAKSQYWGGVRWKTCTITFKQGEDISITFEGQGAGTWVGAPNQTETAGASFTVLAPYSYADADFYIGAGATRTGTAPDFTDIVPGSMTQFFPDDFTIKIVNGLDDKVTSNGIKGPSKTERTAQFSVECDFTMDFSDPSSGFSSMDEFDAYFTGPRTAPLMVVLTHPDMAGNTAQHYQETIDLPLNQLSCENPEPDNEGKQVKAKFKAKSLLPGSNLKPLHWMRVDKAASY